jgi:predicted dehydrogenase
MDGKIIEIAIAGGGHRGYGFAAILASLPYLARVVAVAEPRKEYRERVVSEFSIAPELVFEDWRDMAATPKFCDAVIVSTMDREHTQPAIAFLGQGYHLFLEKPMATTLEECRLIARAHEKAGTIACVCHSMRYHKAFAALKAEVDSGRIGDIVSIDQIEQVNWWHFAHSFIRGNWGNEGRSSFMLLAKSCHDMDYIRYLAGSRCERVQSFGSLSYFKKEHAPQGAGDRCTRCAVESTCHFSAIRRYVNTDRLVWPANVASSDHSAEAHRKAIETGPYGRCVWACDNDVVDHQVVALEFQGGVTATFTMTAFTQEGGRKIRVHGTKGEIEFTEKLMELRTFADGNKTTVFFAPEQGGHGGGDMRAMQSFLTAIRESCQDLVLTGIAESLETHTITFAAEKSRQEGRTVSLDTM